MNKNTLQIKSGLVSFGFFLMLALLGEQLGLYFSPSNRLFGVFLLLFFLAANYEHWRINPIKPKAYVVFWGTIIIGVLVWIAPLSVMSVGFPLLLPVLWNHREQRLNLQVGLVFFIYLLFREYVPGFFLIERGIAEGLNLFLQSISSLRINYSPAAYGFGGLILLMSFSFLQALQAPKNQKSPVNKLSLLLFPLFCYLGLYLIYFWGSTRYLSLPKPSNFGLDFALYYLGDLIFPMNGQGVIFTLAFAATLIFQHRLLGNQPEKTDVSERPATQTPWNPAKILVVLLGLIVVVSLFWNLDTESLDSSRPKPTIYVYATANMDFTTVPNESVYGLYNGFWGMMFDYLKDWGYPVQFGRDWQGLRPENNDILMLVNPNGQIPPTEKATLKSFVYRGGRLFVLGDHTFMFGLQNDYFDLTREMGISFNFDTAIYFREDWKKCLRSPYLTWDEMVKREDFVTGILQGASLSVRFPAVPLIIGQYGWSDPGILENTAGFLGNRQFDTQKPTGDRVLAAERTYGKGKLMVFGDTTFLQNSLIPSAYPLLQLCLNHLRPQKNWRRLLYPLVFLILVVMGLVFQKYWPAKIRTYVCGLNLAGFILLLLAFIWMASLLGASPKYFEIPKPSQALRAGIDQTFFPDHYQRDWSNLNRGIGGLKNNLYRAKFLPYVVYQNDAARKLNLDTLLILAPNRQITSPEAWKILEFIKAGGRLVVACGYDRYNQSRELLDLLKVELQNTPLTKLSEDDTDQKLRFVSAWPIKVLEGNDFTVLCKAWNLYPLVIGESVGQGKAIVIGDSYFFENRNLEGNDFYYQNNQQFIKWLLLK